MRIQDENDSYLKPGMKDEKELKGYAQPSPLLKKVSGGTGKSMMNSPKKKSSNRKKAALGSALGSLGSGANFKN